MNLEIMIPIFLITVSSTLVGIYIERNNSKKTNNAKVIQFPKLKKQEPVIYEENKTPENEKANAFYR